MADVGAMRHVVIFGITEFDLPWLAIPLAAWGAIAAAARRRQRTGQTTPDAPVPIG